MLEILKNKNPEIEVLDVYSDEFASYGRIIEGINIAEIMAEAEKISNPESGSAYMPGVEAFEKLAIAEEIKANALRYQEEVKAEAENFARETRMEACDFADATKMEALQYVDNMLEFFETRFSEDLKTLASNRDSVLFEIQKLNSAGKKAVAQVDEEE